MAKFKILIAAAAFGLVATPSLAMDGDAEAGAKVFKKCAACHNATEAKNKIGPHLDTVFGREVAAVEDFKYSKAMKAFGEGGKVWDEALMAESLKKPKALVKGTKMAFAGLKKEEDVVNVIAYLKSVEE